MIYFEKNKYKQSQALLTEFKSKTSKKTLYTTNVMKASSNLDIFDDLRCQFFH